MDSVKLRSAAHGEGLLARKYPRWSLQWREQANRSQPRVDRQTLGGNDACTLGAATGHSGACHSHSSASPEEASCQLWNGGPDGQPRSPRRGDSLLRRRRAFSPALACRLGLRRLTDTLKRLRWRKLQVTFWNTQ